MHTITVRLLLVASCTTTALIGCSNTQTSAVQISPALDSMLTGMIGMVCLQCSYESVSEGVDPDSVNARCRDICTQEIGKAQIARIAHDLLGPKLSDLEKDSLFTRYHRIMGGNGDPLTLSPKLRSEGVKMVALHEALVERVKSLF